MYKNTFCSFTIIIVLLFGNVTFGVEFGRKKTRDGITDLAKEPDDRLLLFSTIDGSLIAIEQQTGNIKWTTKDQPTVKVPVNTKEAIIPLFLPDPKDGSLYLLGGNNNQILKKLPFTIPQLVASSPCRSSDGILYTGKKKDTWFMMDPETGSRQKILGFEKSGATCPVTSPNAVYVGRTQYTIMMIDSKAKDRHWNVTFYDYTASPMTKEMLNSYELVHFTASSTGRVVTLDRRIGRLLWEKDLGSPVVAIYILDPDGFLTAPFSSLAHDTLTQLASHFSTHEHPFSSQPSHMQLYPTLYIGEHLHGLYALPSLVDQNVVTISATNSGPLLLEGPGSVVDPSHHRAIPLPGMNVKIDPSTDQQLFQSIHENLSPMIVLGYYNVPDYSPTRLQISGRVSEFLPENIAVENATEQEREQFESQPKEPETPIHVLSVAVQTDPTNDSENTKHVVDNSSSILKRIYFKSQAWLNQQENKALKLILIILVGCMIAMFWYIRAQFREFQQLSQSGSRGSQPSSNGKYGPVTAIAEDLPDGIIRVGKITFMPDQLLGKGCDGTFVYRGKFDNRDVAVKRLLPECFTFADREVSLLRESDEHPHVIRYFCMEQDRQFRYIALELCAATVQDYVQGRYDISLISPLEILEQATSGLAHLHSLDIVHRDIKPPNVLLSMPNVRGEVRAMISDFGLCKKLQVGRMSFSRRSGITGTDGWIAPEMLNGNERTTCAVDMFSLGCLFYYVLSEGKHPFGEPLRRQANILSGDYRLNELKGEEVRIELSRMLISKLISIDATQRPPASVVLIYPLFWNNASILAFYQDVSDRIEKAEISDPVLLSLEHHGQMVVRGDWRRHIDPEVAQDLRKYRSYRGESVRDLLRALRNKKHHYRELSTEAQHSLGDIPDKFTTYWNARFPLLLLHSWLAMQCVKQETTFRQYYQQNFSFTEKSFKDTCYPTNSLYSTKHCDYLDSLPFEEPCFDEFSHPNDFSKNLKNQPNFWVKKQKSKPQDYRNSSPRKNKMKPFQQDPKLKTFEEQNTEEKLNTPQNYHRNVSPSKRRTTDFQNRAKNTEDVEQSRFKNKLYRNQKQGEVPLVWTLPPEVKKMQ